MRQSHLTPSTSTGNGHAARSGGRHARLSSLRLLKVHWGLQPVLRLVWIHSLSMSSASFLRSSSLRFFSAWRTSSTPPAASSATNARAPTTMPAMAPPDSPVTRAGGGGGARMLSRGAQLERVVAARRTGDGAGQAQGTLRAYQGHGF